MSNSRQYRPSALPPLRNVAAEAVGGSLNRQRMSPSLYTDRLTRPGAAAMVSRSSALLAVAPIAVLSLICGISLTERAAAAMTGPAAVADGTFRSAQHRPYAEQVCSEVIGVPVNPTAVHCVRDYSRRNNRLCPLWNVTCGSSQDQYFLQIDANRRSIHAVNRLNASAPTAARPLAVSCEFAEARARHYLQLVKPAESRVTLLGRNAPHATSADSPDDVLNWGFNYEAVPPRGAERSVHIAIDAYSGGLESLWIPRCNKG